MFNILFRQTWWKASKRFQFASVREHVSVLYSRIANFTVAAATAWNRLSPKVRPATFTEQFSRALKTHLFTLDWSRGSPRRFDALFPLMNYDAGYKLNNWFIDWILSIARVWYVVGLVCWPAAILCTCYMTVHDFCLQLMTRWTTFWMSQEMKRNKMPLSVKYLMRLALRSLARSAHHSLHQLHKIGNFLRFCYNFPKCKSIIMKFISPCLLEGGRG